jgi:hypothetical protein
LAFYFVSQRWLWLLKTDNTIRKLKISAFSTCYVLVWGVNIASLLNKKGVKVGQFTQCKQWTEYWNWLIKR